MPSSLEEQLQAELDALRQLDRYRTCPPLSGSSRRDVSLGDTTLVSFSSNDYLGLACHPKVKQAAMDACNKVGVGAGASRLVSGDHPHLRDLETALSLHFGAQAALVFPTGYQANIGVITALAGLEDLILSDALNHASLIDGCRLSRAKVLVYAHASASHAAQVLQNELNQRRFRRIFVITESLFSMDGDIAPLRALQSLCLAHNACLIVDEAHAVGCLGPGGRGLSAANGISPDLRMGTLGKSFGAAGGFVLTSSIVRDHLINRARSFIFTTALPAPVAAAAHAALEVVASGEGDELRSRLASRISQLQGALGLHGPLSPIVPLVLGSDLAALAASAHLREQGLFVQAIRPPTVPEGMARLRLTLSAAHTTQQVSQLATALSALPRVGSP